jgi:hypothetical protein
MSLIKSLTDRSKGGLLQNLQSSIFGDDEATRVRRATAFNSMRLNPDKTLAASLENRRTDLKSASNVNQSIAMLRAQGHNDLADYATSNPSMINEIMKQALSNQFPTKSGIKSYAPDVDPDGNQYIPTFNPNTGQVENVYTGIEGLLSEQDKITFTQNEASRIQDVNVRNRKMAEMYQQSDTMKSKLYKMDSILNTIEDGAWAGWVADFFPNMRESSAELALLKGELGLDVVSSVTFGALSERELALAMATAVPPHLAGQELKEWVISKSQAMEKYRVELNKKILRMGQAENMTAFIQSESKIALEDSKSNWYNLSSEDKELLRSKTKNIQGGMTYMLWQNLNPEQRRETLKRVGAL